MFRYRLATAAVALPFLLLFLWAGEPWYTGLILAATGWGLWEVLAVTGVKKSLWVLGSTLLALLFPLSASLRWGLTAPLLMTLVVLLLLALLWGPSREQTLAPWVVTLGAPLYIGWLLSYWVLLRHLSSGAEWTLFALLSTFGSDTAAYGVGKRWGRHRLAPKISPGKSWEGALGGIVGCVLVAFVLSLIVGLPLGLLGSVVTGMVISLAAQAGDLVESALKRSGGVKDAGWLLPGHGGLLDRLDSLLLVGPVAYLLALWVS